MESGDAQVRQRVNTARTARSGLVVILIMALLLFVPAGTWRWTLGWVFFCAYLVATIVAVAVLWRVNPEIFVARSGFHAGTKRWDAVLLVFMLSCIVAILPVAAVDAERFELSQSPWPVIGLGYVLFMGGFAITTWAQAVNRFFEPSVRIQTDRGHEVIDRGPYAIVRHPGYVGAFLLLAGVALALGSLWALVPAALASLLLILRTHWEDQTLRAELPGYQAYTLRVRFRLIPGVW
jgi:protein-S-isoprenylcysteine O-methyltransferase Ste14